MSEAKISKLPEATLDQLAAAEKTGGRIAWMFAAASIVGMLGVAAVAGFWAGLVVLMTAGCAWISGAAILAAIVFEGEQKRRAR